jgi:transketolase
MEGVSHEAIGLAGKQRLSKLIVLWDDNGISIDGKVELSDITDQMNRFAASGWSVFACDGHDPEAIDKAITQAKQSPRPSLIACKTHIGFGSPAKQDTSGAHGAPLGDAEIALVRKAYGWTSEPFIIPADIKSAWEAIGARGASAHTEWTERKISISERKQEEFDRVVAGVPPKRLGSAVRTLKKQITADLPKVATRKSSEMALAAINPVMPETIGGSADLTGSNLTLTSDMGVFDADNRKGRYVYYGIREHGMAAAMNGLALHGGCAPYGGTFMVFSDYAKGAMRLSSLMGLRAVYVLTHDSIGLGEDGPTHQPIEQLAMMRATPNLNVFRPADTVETAEAWELALSTEGTPSALALSRQGLPTVRTKYTNKNLTAQGAYVLKDAENKRQAILMATGSEVEIALAAREILEAKGIGTRVVSMPCWELFEAQDEKYRKRVLPAGSVRVAIEAAGRFGWDKWLTGERGNSKKAAFVGMEGFGASAPIGELYEHFGITAEAVVAKVEALLV